MFKLVTLEDTITVPARLFGHARELSIENVINKRLSDRVIPHIGLVIAVWDLLSLGDSKLVRGTGDSATLVRFRVVVFAPFVGETVFARVLASTEAGLGAHTDFFHAIWVPKERLPKPSEFDAAEKVWQWKPTFDGDVQMSYFMDATNDTVVRVTAVEYNDNRDANRASTSARDTKPANVMTIKASLYDEFNDDNQGLGDPLWWYEEQEEEEDGGQASGDDANPVTDGADAHSGEGHANGNGDAEDDAYEEAEEEDGGGDWMGQNDFTADDDFVLEDDGEAAVDDVQDDE